MKIPGYGNILSRYKRTRQRLLSLKRHKWLGGMGVNLTEAVLKVFFNIIVHTRQLLLKQGHSSDADTQVESGQQEKSPK